MYKIKAGVIKTALAFIFPAALMQGCALVSLPGSEDKPGGDFSLDPEEIVLTMPVTAAVERDQMLIVQLSELLDLQAVNAKDRAGLFYELGVIYDRLGLEASARTMFMNALVEKPDFAPAYNFLGIYLTSAERFADAFEAFGAALELEPDSAYTHFARALALYYSGRPEMALQDIDFFYQSNPKDPYSMLWYYLIEQELQGRDQALQRLRDRVAQAGSSSDDFFGYHIIDYLLGTIDRAALLHLIKDPEVPMYLKVERACEVYFYLAKEAQSAGNLRQAFDYFHLARSTDKYDFLEYRYALFEIRRMAGRYGLHSYRDVNPLREPDSF